MNGDGTGQSMVNTPDGRSIFSWSPDEQTVLFFKQGEPTKIYLSGADGSGETLVPIHGGSWSPDSKMIVYAFRGSRGIISISLSIRSRRMISEIPTVNLSEADPSFTPDGNQVAFSGNQDGNQEIYSVNWTEAACGGLPSIPPLTTIPPSRPTEHRSCLPPIAKTRILMFMS